MRCAATHYNTLHHSTTCRNTIRRVATQCTAAAQCNHTKTPGITEFGREGSAGITHLCSRPVPQFCANRPARADRALSHLCVVCTDHRACRRCCRQVPRRRSPQAPPLEARRRRQHAGRTPLQVTRTIATVLRMTCGRSARPSPASQPRPAVTLTASDVIAETNTASWGCARGTLGTLALLVGTLVLPTDPTNASSPRAVDGLARSLFCSVSSFAPTTAGCLAEWQACKDSPASCCAGTYCYRQDQWYSQCRTTGVSSHPLR